jgi:hypothetical protein
VRRLKSCNGSQGMAHHSSLNVDLMGATPGCAAKFRPYGCSPFAVPSRVAMNRILSMDSSRLRTTAKFDLLHRNAWWLRRRCA